MLVALARPMFAWIKSRHFASLSILGFMVLAVNGYPYRAPELLWTQDDLPSTAREDDNGWMVVSSDRVDGDIPKPLTELLNPPDHDAVQFWQRVARVEGLPEFLTSDAAREAIERVDAARRMPTFVEDDCTFDRTCTSMVWIELHRIASLHAIDLATRGEVADATMLLRDLIRMDATHLASARSLLSILIAVANLQDAMTIADMIAQRDAADPNPALAALGSVVEGLNLAVGLERIVIGEYLAQVEFLAKRDARASGIDRWFYNHALTLRIINPRFEHRHQSALAHDSFGALGGGEPSPKQELGWWVRNPIGKRILDKAGWEPTSLAVSLDENLAALAETRSLLLSRPGVRARARATPLI